MQDDALNGVHDPQTGAANNADTLVADAAVVGMVGPFNSNVARAEIPVTNEAGLAQCSPSNTGTDLTKEGSEAYRFNGQDERNYFRVATPDDIQGPAGAQYAFNDLGKTKALVIDDTEAFGVGVANTFSDEFTSLGGTIAARDRQRLRRPTRASAAILTANQRRLRRRLLRRHAGHRRWPAAPRHGRSGHARHPARRPGRHRRPGRRRR